LLNQRYELEAVFNKPFIVAELGINYNDPNIDRTKWIAEAMTAMKDEQKYPSLPAGFTTTP
jgi:hypothetical protein